MSFNRVTARKLLGTVLTPSGKLISISAATITDAWTRPEWVAEKMKEPMEQAVVANEDLLPPGTVEVCSREGEHESPGDERTHITAVCLNKTGGHIRSVHLPKKK